MKFNLDGEYPSKQVHTPLSSVFMLSEVNTPKGSLRILGGNGG